MMKKKHIKVAAAVLAAVLEGRIDIDTLNDAVRRVLQWKIDLGLI